LPHGMAAKGGARIGRMRWSFARYVSLLLLVVILAALGSWRLHAKALAHELAHDRGTAHAGAHDHPLAALLEADDDDDGDLTCGSHRHRDADHEVLHAIGHGAPAVLSTFGTSPYVEPGMVPCHFVAHRLEYSAAEAPFRPPRQAIPA
jgi:uncharacterized protein involved in copper resistance